MNSRDSSVPDDSREIEQEIRDKGLTAPRITPISIEAKIAGENFHHLERTLILCVLTLENGYTVTGESACASPENFDLKIGKKIARRNAVDKIWSLEGYLLKEKLYQESKRADVLRDNIERSDSKPVEE